MQEKIWPQITDRGGRKWHDKKKKTTDQNTGWAFRGSFPRNWGRSCWDHDSQVEITKKIMRRKYYGEKKDVGWEKGGQHENHLAAMLWEGQGS